ncbi:cytochrome P450, putative [Talaromyces stipitatus ATCC 10500]|uniref:Cytochrome P450, putative n=1 Tax=Talaromyces stipitatus (strain ATCC 10500 / CBS 375.48 / QM 6759 / NRRL 1006) TaxID=441959 RepID=B8MCI5_TALSN|nr:cytochrome P450, putative [Talaromyces stipitatus ATCC 10500]EED18801.1 cytochrome P450, putative [Talaromyces stipitatus ATCC 10500]
MSLITSTGIVHLLYAHLFIAILLGIAIHDYILSLRMPPGPRPLPFVGNRISIPKKSPWIQFEKWSQIYGPIYTLWMGRRPTIIISDPNVAVDLLEKRSNKYSSRPRFVVMGELYWDNASILVQPYSREWQLRRKLLHQALNPQALKVYKPIQEAEATRLCHQLFLNPAAYEGLIDRFTSSVVFSISYGHRIDSMNAKVIRQRLEFMQYAASLNVPGKYLVESIPALKYLPNWLAPWKREIQERGRLEAATNMSLVHQMQEEMFIKADIPESLTKILLHAKEEDPESFSLLSERDFSFIPASLFGAGSDTTASTLCSGILMLITNPETLQAAHAELDAVVGTDRMPTFEDEKSLSYINAMCSEILRIRPVAVLGGTPHANSESDVYQGYCIPKGTTILSNSWAINLNPRYYPNPHHFNPLRFLPNNIPSNSLPYLPKEYVETTPSEKGEPHPSRDGHSSFGWGRRICPGAGLARNSLFIAIAKMLWTFDILPVTEKDGSARKYDTFAYTEGFNVRPKPFECIIKVRSEKHATVLEREFVEAERTMGKFSAFSE